jgi:DNA repair protein RAD16
MYVHIRGVILEQLSLTLSVSQQPAIEQQAIDRVMRIGQTRPVTVVRFLMEDSVEERIVALQEKKKELAKSALDGNPKDIAKLTLRDIQELFR